jgi:predicted permease
VAVISHRYWQNEFGGDPSALHQTITVNQVPATVVGVMPESFRGPWQVGREPQVIVPASVGPLIEKNSPLVDRPGRRTPYWLLVMGRMKPGATRQQVQDYFAGSFQSIALELVPPPRRTDEPVTLEAKDYPHLVALPGNRGLWEMRKVYSPRILVLFGSVGLVLLIACANVANLLLSRAATRGTEITLRLAMGAGRGRVARQLLTESVLLACTGGVLGALLSIWGTRALGTFGETDGLLPEGMTYGLNWRVLAFTAAASILTGAIFGVVPAWRASRHDLSSALKDSTRTGTHASRSWFSRGLIVTQVAMSLVLLLAAGLLVRTLANLQRVDTGFNQEQLLVFQVRPRNAGWTGERIRAFYSDVAARLDGLPAVRSATFSQMPLVAHYMYGTAVILPGEVQGSAPNHPINYLIVRENFTDAMEIPVVRGRAFRPQDGPGPKVALVNETFVREYMTGKDPIGQRIGVEDVDGPIEIVGVTRDIVYNHQREEKEPLVYVPWRQEAPMGEGAFAIRTNGDPLGLAGDVRAAMRAVAPAVPVEELMTQRMLSDETLAEERQYATLIGLAAALAVGLAAIGLYGVIAYWVAQRTREIGIRMALGAQTAMVLRLVVRQALALVALGLVVGGVAAALLARYIESRLYQVRPSDPLTIAVVAAVLFGMALAACVVPARRAAKLDPMIAFRVD